MTNNTPQTIKDILHTFLAENYRLSRNIPEDVNIIRVVNEQAIDEAVSAVEVMMLGVIGEDEDENSLSSNPKLSIEPHFRNKQRAEQRKALHTALYGEENV